MTNKRGAIAELQAALLLTMIALSMSYVVFSQLQAAPSQAPVFFNRYHLISGPSPLILLETNASSPVRLRSLQIDNVVADGVFTFDGDHYSSITSLCQKGVTTFFSVLTSSPGPLQVTTDGESWISGRWTDSLSTSPGWHEVMIVNGSSCLLSLPDGSTVATFSPRVSQLPLTGKQNSSFFEVYLPWSGSSGHALLLIFQEGMDRIAL